MPYSSNWDIWIAGAFAAFSVDLMVYPLDTLKTRIQSPNYKQLYTHATTGRVNRALLYRGLYQGLWSVVLATIPSSGAFFTTYETSKHLLSQTPLPTPLAHTLASSSGELVSCFILTPAEVLKQNAQMITRVKHGTAGAGPGGAIAAASTATATMQVLARFRHHPTRLWRGYGALVARNLPFVGLQFPMFEHMKKYLIERREKQKEARAASSSVFTSIHDSTALNPVIERTGITAVSAGLAGSIASTVTTPIDVVKTRIMLAADGGSSAAGSPSSKYIRQHSWTVGKEIYRTEGIKGLFRGGALRAGWTAFGMGLYLGAYEGGRLFLENRRRDRMVDEGHAVM